MWNAIKGFFPKQPEVPTSLSTPLLQDANATVSSRTGPTGGIDSRAQENLQRSADIRTTQPNPHEIALLLASSSRVATEEDLLSALATLVSLRVHLGMEKMTPLNFREHVHAYLVNNMFLLNNAKFQDCFHNYDESISLRMGIHKDFLGKIKISADLHDDEAKFCVIRDAFNEIQTKLVHTGIGPSEVFYKDAVIKTLSVVKNFYSKENKIKILDFLIKQDFLKGLSQNGQKEMFGHFANFVSNLKADGKGEIFEELAANLIIHGKLKPKELKAFLKSHEKIIQGLAGKDVAEIFKKSVQLQTKTLHRT